MGEEGGTGMESVKKQKSYLVLLVCYCRNTGSSVFYGKKKGKEWIKIYKLYPTPWSLVKDVQIKSNIKIWFSSQIKLHAFKMVAKLITKGDNPLIS